MYKNLDVLVSTKRQVKRLSELTDQETADLFIVAKKVQRVIDSYYKTESTTVTVQDGPDAGQTVNHVHVHIIPRNLHNILLDDLGASGDFGDNEIYHALQGHEDRRKARSFDVMKSEAKIYRNLMH